MIRLISRHGVVLVATIVAVTVVAAVAVVVVLIVAGIGIWLIVPPSHTAKPKKPA